MLKMILKTALILNIFAFSICAQANENKTSLANQCFELSRKVSNLISDQKYPICVDKLKFAALQMNSAANYILNEANDSAKQLIQSAVFALEYAQFSGCNQYIKIVHSKHEANELKSLL